MAKVSHRERTVEAMARGAIELWIKKSPSLPLTPRELSMLKEIVGGYMSIVYSRAVNVTQRRARRAHHA